MPEFIKVRLIEMLDKEVEQTNGEISNNNIWLKSCLTKQEQTTFIETIVDLEEYRAILLEMKRQVETGEFNV